MPEFLLGKQPVRLDSRTLRLATILRTLPPLPPEYDNDTVLGVQDDRPFGNLQYGDCVLAGRAHMTLRFESFEQKRVLNIADTEVIGEYMIETGGKDSGLVMLDSLNAWRKGWIAEGKLYDIHAFTSMDWKNHGEVMAAIYLLSGAYAGLLLPTLAQVQVGKIWEVDDGPAGAVGSWGGHSVYIMAYNAIGPVCMTWGKRQQMTWAFWNKYAEEAYAIIDNPDKWMANSPVNTDLLEKQLAEITSNPPPTPTPTPQPVGCCPAGVSLVRAALKMGVTFKRKK